MQTFRIVFGLCAGLALMLAGLVLEGGHPSVLMSLPALVVVGGGALSAIVIACPFKEIGLGIRLVFLSAKVPRAEVEAAQRVYASAGKGALLSGFLGAVLGAIQVFAHFDKPEFIGPGVALAILSIAYGFAVNVFLAQPLASLAKTKIQPPAKTGDDHEHKSQPIPLHRAA